MEYNKPPLTHQEQVDLWKKRGLIVEDNSRAIRYLSDVSYYRLSAYALPFQVEKDTFVKGTTFNQILNQQH